MRVSDITRLIGLAAIWGASFLFLRIAAPVLGTAWVTELRISIAAVAMLAYARAFGYRLDFRRNLPAYAVIGMLQVALPWSMYAFAGHHLGASYLALLNASTPSFSAVFGALWLGEQLTRRVTLGLAFGALGVALVVGFGPVEVTSRVLISAALCIAGSAGYALTGIYMKKRAAHVSPFSLTLGTLLTAAPLLLPFLLMAPVPSAPTLKIALAVLGLALLGSAVAFVLYFRLIADIGPTKTQTVTFITPLFGILFGVVFLDEELRPAMLLGGALILAGTALVVMRGTKARSVGIVN